MLKPLKTTKCLLSRDQLQKIQEKIGIIFRRLDLLEQAFIHRSLLNEYPSKNLESNERLEFLGDKVLGASLGHYLFRNFPDAPEGHMTSIFGMVASTKILSMIAEELQLGLYILMSKGEKNDFDSESLSRERILCNTLEALIAAIYLDRGLGTVELFLSDVLFPRIKKLVTQEVNFNPKSRLQELCQEQFQVTPSYEIVCETGLDHKKQFVALVLLREKVMGQGKGYSKAAAETTAARDALWREFEVESEEVSL